jgi:hypothetical protein
MKFNIFTIVLALMANMACQNTNDKKIASTEEGQPATVETKAPPVEAPKNEHRNPALLGKWQGVEWIFMDKPAEGFDPLKVSFDFREDGVFYGDYGPQHKTGTWRTTKDSLYTKDAGVQREVSSKILTADGNLLDLQFNVKGQKEIIKFKKVKQ